MEMKKRLMMMFLFCLHIIKKKQKVMVKNIDGKPDYADVFEDNQIFCWDTQIGKVLIVLIQGDEKLIENI